MAQPAIKTSFASGEWSPKLQSRVDIAKYHSGAALMRNWYVDYSGGGASTRQGTKFINQVKASGARLIPFQPSTNLSYVLEFGQNYIRFHSNGAPIVEAATAITGVTNANPGVITDVAHGYATGDWVLLSGIGGTTQLNGNYYIVVRTGANTFTLTDLNGNAINTTTFGVYTSGGAAQRVYTITSPYLAVDLFPNPTTGNPGLKFVQDVTSLIITHPSYAPAILTINTPTNWTIINIAFGPTIPTSSQPSITSTSASGGGWNYSYRITGVDANGQEGPPSLTNGIGNLGFIGNTPTVNNTISWGAATPGAVSYNVYKALPSYQTAIPAGAQYGFIGNVTGLSMLDGFPGITPDFSQTPTITQNPFLGAGVIRYAVTAAGSYTVVPGVIVGVPAAGGIQATAQASLAVTVVGGITHATANDDIQSTTDPNGSLLVFPDGVILSITSTTPAPNNRWTVNSVSLVNAGSIVSGGTPSNPVPPTSCSASGFQSFNPVGGAFGVSLTWGVVSISVVNPGSNYTSVPAVTFSAGAATATAFLGTAGVGNPGAPGFMQQRLMLAGQGQAVQSFNLSQPTSFFNFNTSNPSQDDDAISGTIISEELNDIRSLLSVPTGIIAFTGKGAWLINGGGGLSVNNAITPANVVASPQAFNGANDLKPFKINMDALYCTNKGNYVRDLTYNIYAGIYTGSDISVLSNHLFFGFYMPDWAWSEEPFKTLWAVRSDGQMLSLGFVKEQELIGWAHHDTNGQFKSVCSVIETISGNVVDAVYIIVERIVNGFTVQYIERMADRYFPYGYEDAWSVDCALQTVPLGTGTAGGSVASFIGANVVGSTVTVNFTGGSSPAWTSGNVGNVLRASGGLFTVASAPTGRQITATVTSAATNFNPYTNVAFPDPAWSDWLPVSTVSGLTQLIGQNVVGVADGVAVGPFTVSVTGTVALGLTATKVTLGLAFLPQLKTLPLDLGEPTVQGKRKKITGITLRVADTLGLQIGKTFPTAVPMKDFTLGNVGTQSNQIVTGLVNGDGRTIIDQAWEEAGNYCIQQTLPYPATVLAAMPEVVVGDK